jgi:hypothetical protein
MFGAQEGNKFSIFKKKLSLRLVQAYHSVESGLQTPPDTTADY